MYAAWRYNIYGAGRVIYQVTDLGRKPFRIQVFFFLEKFGKLFTHMCLCHQAVEFDAGQASVMPCGWEGNRRADVALAMLKAYETEMSTPTLLMGYGSFYLTLPSQFMDGPYPCLLF